MAAGRILLPVMPARDRNGELVSGAKLYFYDSGTTTPKAVYTTADLTTQHPQPVVADSAGAFPAIWGDTEELYSAVAYAPDGVMLPRASYEDVRPAETTLFFVEQLSDQVDRAILVPNGEAGLTIPEVSDRRLKIFSFDEDGAAVAELSPDSITEYVMSQILDLTPEVQEAIDNYLASKVGGVWYSGVGEPSEDIGTTGDFYRQSDVDPSQVWYRQSNGWSIERDVYGSKTSAVTIPDGALAVWFFDEAETADGVLVVPNQITKDDTPPSPNMVPNPTRFWDTTLFVDNTGATKAVSGDAMTVDLGTDGYVTLAAGDWEAGTYTIVVDAERNAGTDQTFRIGWLNGGISGDKVATATRQRFSHTATLSAGADTTLIAYPPVAGTDNVKLKIHSVAVYKGTEDLEPEGTAYAGHIVVGKKLNDTDASVESWGVDLGATPTPATAQWAAAQDLTEFTLIVLYKNVTSTNFHSFASAKGDYTTFDLMERRSATLSNQMAFQHTTALHLFTKTSSYPSLGLGWRSMALRLDAAGNAAIFNGLSKAIYGAETAPTTYTLRDLMFNATTDYAFPAGMAYAGAILVAEAWTDAQVRQGMLALEQRASGLVVNPPARKIIALGDSLTASGIYVTTDYADADDTLVATWAVGGYTLANLNTQATLVDTIPAFDTDDQQTIASVLIGANDLSEGYTSPFGNGTGSTGYLADLIKYHTERKAAGFVTVAGTILNRTAVPGFDTLRNAVNTGLRAEAADPEGVIDYIVDFADDPDIGTAEAVNDPTWFTDGLHPTTAGYERMTEIIVAAMDAIPMP